jgi:hypothetical protein
MRSQTDRAKHCVPFNSADSLFKPTVLVIIPTTAMRLTMAPPELLRLLIIAIVALLTPLYAKDVTPPTFQITFTQNSFDFQ